MKEELSDLNVKFELIATALTNLVEEQKKVNDNESAAEIRKALLDIADLKVETSVHINTALTHRKLVDDRLKDIMQGQNIIEEKIDKFPCDKREGWYKSLTRQVGFMWLVLGGIMITLFLEITKRRN